MRYSRLGDGGGQHATDLLDAKVADNGERNYDYTEDFEKVKADQTGYGHIPFTLAAQAKENTGECLEIIVSVRGSRKHIAYVIAKFEGYDPISIGTGQLTAKLEWKDKAILSPDDNGVPDMQIPAEDWYGDDDARLKNVARFLIFKRSVVPAEYVSSIKISVHC